MYHSNPLIRYIMVQTMWATETSKVYSENPKNIATADMILL